MDTPNNGAAAPEERPAPSLRDELAQLVQTQMMARETGGEAREPSDWERQFADSILHLLNERGHYMPGCPPAAQILRDAEQFAGQFMLAMLCVRLLRMLNTQIITPETKGMEKWLTDYIDGRNHGPIGKPMLWPGGLKGLSEQLRQWGYQPTPTRPQFVGRAVVSPTMTMQ